MVTSANFDELRRLNFGVRTLQKPLSREVVQQAFASYDPADAEKVAATMRSAASLTKATDQYLTVYDEVIRAGKTVRTTRHQRRPLPVPLVISTGFHLLSRTGIAPSIGQRNSAPNWTVCDRGSCRPTWTRSKGPKNWSWNWPVRCSETAALREQVALRENELTSIKASRAWRAVQAYGRIKHKLWKPR